MRCAWPLLAMALLAGCGRSSDTGTTIKTSNGAISTGGSSCAVKPDFVPIYAGATIVSCVAESGRATGTIIYTAPAPPAAVLGWSRDAAVKSGFALTLESQTVFSAETADKRTMMVMVSPENGGTHVTLNWDRKP